jgi:DNA repair protein RadC
MDSEKKNYQGHRERMKKKLLRDGSGLLDYELLETMLFFAIPRRDTKALAKRLLQRFRTIRGIIFADSAELLNIDGVGTVTIGLLIMIRELFARVCRENISGQVTITSSGQVIDYYKNILGALKKEQLRVMFLNNRNKLLADDVLQTGTVNQTAIYPREIIQRALEHGASGMIMVHNHPGGDPHPSRQDIIMTETIRDIAQRLDIQLLDHVIIGKNESKSLKELGLM